MSKLIILRGNSGSGKSTVAKALREQLKSGRKIAIIPNESSQVCCRTSPDFRV